MQIYVMNGPNLNMLGKRPQKHYGQRTLEEINEILQDEAGTEGIELVFFQSNHEGELIDFIHEAVGKADGLIINPGAYGHYSIALRDALEILAVPIIEVHLSNVYARENFRQVSLVSPLAAGIICGLGPLGYQLAMQALKNILKG